MTKKKKTEIDKGTKNYIKEQTKRISEQLYIDTSSCSHSNLVPIEVSFIRITHPNGYKEP